MLTQPLKDIAKRAKKIERLLKNVNALFKVKVMQDSSQAGGGSLPLLNLPTFVIALSPAVQGSQLSVNDLEERLRKSERPVIARIKEDALLLDARTIQDSEIKELVDSVKVALKD
jgi:L-seryl-tRNA(Ser) seleniumtransferase